jgi:hypothetical protein
LSNCRPTSVGLGGVAHQHRLADPRFEQLDALGDGRLRQAQHLRGALETACSITAARAASSL